MDILLEQIAIYKGVIMSEEIKTVPFMWDIPESTVELEMVAKCYIDGEIKKATSTIKDIGTIRKGMIAGEEYDEANAVYELVEGDENAFN